MRWKRVFTGPSVTALAVLGIGAAVLLAAVQGLGLTLIKSAVPPAKPMYLLGDALGSYRKAETLRLSKAIADELGTDRYAFRTYQKPGAAGAAGAAGGDGGDGGAVQLLMAYQTGVPDAVPHIPRRLFVLGGGRGEVIGRRTFKLPTRRLDDEARRKLAATATAEGEAQPSESAGTVDVPVTLMKARPPHGGGGPRWVAGYLFIANGRLTAGTGDVRRWVADLRTDRAYWCRIEILPGRVRRERFAGMSDPERAAAAIERFLLGALPDTIRMMPDRPGASSAR